MNFNRLKRLLFPHISVCLLLLPVAATLLVYSMTSLTENNPFRIAAYVLSFYTLMIWCFRIPTAVIFFKRFKNENRYISVWTNEPRLRMNVTLTVNVLWNGAYAVLQLGMGIYHRSAWFYSLFGYYASLAVMRFFLVRHTMRHAPGKEMHKELKRYRACGWIFLIMNLALSGIMLYMISENRTVHHSEITTIAMAAYTFTTLTFAVVNVVKYRKYNSPAMSAAKAISLAVALVSLLTLENTMLTTFANQGMTAEIKLMFLSLSGGGVSVFIVIMALYMIVQSNKKIKYSEK